MITPLNERDLPLILDGGMGRELRMRGVEILDTIWSANGLITAPAVVRDIHMDYIEAGADIITTNSYGVILQELVKEGIAGRYDELNQLAGQLAVEARDRSGADVLIAGSLPPLRGSYRPDLVDAFAVIEPEYARQVALLTPFVDLFICETMSSADEGYAAAHAAVVSGKPVWVSWTLHEDRTGRLRSGESIADAAARVAELPITGMLANCCAPESIAAAMGLLTATGNTFVGGYANTFVPVAPDWTLDGNGDDDGLIALRDDLSPEHYATCAADWVANGATVVGGCCGTGPAHIKRIASAHAATRIA